VNVICADTDERAHWLAGPSALAFLKLRTGKPEALVTPEEAAEYPYNDIERAFVEDRWNGQAVGSPETVTRQLTDLLSRTGANELMLTTMVYDLADRTHSYELVAEKVAPTLTR
jgi:alkanesulfonate monooxygenase SsuD/methylene tetrahydromethanopterin reductase-like flavin-dependent oxidoreductase (luciferase family)